MKRIMLVILVLVLVVGQSVFADTCFHEHWASPEFPVSISPDKHCQEQECLDCGYIERTLWGDCFSFLPDDITLRSMSSCVGLCLMIAICVIKTIW